VTAVPSWVPVVSSIALFLIGIYNAIIGYFLRQHMARTDKIEERQTALDKRIQDLENKLPFVYVLREDWIRAQAAVEHKLDDIAKMIMELRITSNSHGKGGENHGD
jgi:hypothetical protein